MSIHVLLIALLRLSLVFFHCHAFLFFPVRHYRPAASPLHRRQSSVLPTLFLASGYVPPEAAENNPPTTDISSSSSSPKKSTKKSSLFPKVGDVVRYYDLDGGREDGQVLVGRISFIQTRLGRKDEGGGDGVGDGGWTVEIAELDDVGDGYYAEYPARKRDRKRATRDLTAVSPIAASFVGSENAYKVPLLASDDGDGRPRPVVRAERYDVENYPGPFAGPENAVDQTVVEADAALYTALKGRLLRYVAVAGLAGTLIADLVKGIEDAAVYFAGALAGLAYVFFLSIKTDTLASPGARFGSNISNLRFAMPPLVLVAVALYNRSLGESNPVVGGGPFDTVTPEQFAAAVLGFLTYRLPLFFIQLQDSLKDDELSLPGSAGVAMQLAKGESAAIAGSQTANEGLGTDLATVFVISGPQATGRSELVQRLIQEGEGRFVEPKRVDRVRDAIAFERLERRDEFLSVDRTGRYGVTKDGILSVARECGSDSVVVVDADVNLARQLSTMSGARLIGVWVGLNSVHEFEDRLGEQIDTGEIAIPDDESRDSVLRARIREVVQEIEFGIASGIFEFTILNDNEDESLQQLREAASYCFT